MQMLFPRRSPSYSKSFRKYKVTIQRDSKIVLENTAEINVAIEDQSLDNEERLIYALKCFVLSTRRVHKGFMKLKEEIADTKRRMEEEKMREEEEDRREREVEEKREKSRERRKKKKEKKKERKEEQKQEKMRVNMVPGQKLHGPLAPESDEQVDQECQQIIEERLNQDERGEMRLGQQKHNGRQKIEQRDKEKERESQFYWANFVPSKEFKIVKQVKVTSKRKNKIVKPKRTVDNQRSLKDFAEFKEDSLSFFLSQKLFSFSQPSEEDESLLDNELKKKLFGYRDGLDETELFSTEGRITTRDQEFFKKKKELRIRHMAEKLKREKLDLYEELKKSNMFLSD